MTSSLITIFIAGISVYLFYQHSFILAVSLLILAIWRLVGVGLQGLVDVINQMKRDRDSSVALDIKINIAELLDHPSLITLFDRLSQDTSDNYIATDITTWKNKILNGYKRKYDNDGVWEAVKFNIKNGVLWKNGTPDFSDFLYHEIFVPYDLELFENKGFSPAIGTGITVRVFVVNGMVKLQVGEFSKEYTPRLLRGGSLSIYQTYETICSFPLMYFSYKHCIPKAHLNLSVHATESWKNEHWNTDIKKADIARDWKKLNEEIRDYEYVCALANEYLGNRSRWDKIIKYFDEKRGRLLKNDGFSDPFARNEDSNDYFAHEFLRSSDINYRNKYMQIYVSNLNESTKKNRREKYTLTDYWEELP
jgi:hypothetical protein